MKINLVNPPNLEHSGTFRPPINLAILAAYVRQYGHQPKIYDFEAQHIDIPEKIAEILMQDSPEVIGFSCLTPRYPIIVKIARSCKRISRNTIILLGGSHVTGDPKSVFYDPSIDYAIIGEGEEALLDFLNHLEDDRDISKIFNLALRAKKSILINPLRPFIKNLDTLPFPAWDLLPIKLYTDPIMFHSNYMGIISARGCAWNCNFCASRVTWGGKVRMRSAKNLIAELKCLINKYNISEFMFYDDTFTVDRKRTIEICNLIKEESIKIRYYVSLRADSIDYEVARLLKDTGCILVFLGVESGDEEILKMTGKGETKDQIRLAMEIFKDVKLPVLNSFILGHPGDTHKSIQATIDFAKELDSEQVRFLIAVPYPGTHLYKLAQEKGILQNTDPMKLAEYVYYQHVAVNFSCVTNEGLLRYQKQAYEEYDLQKQPLI